MFPELAQVSLLAIYRIIKKGKKKKAGVNVFSTKVKQSAKGTALLRGHRSHTNVQPFVLQRQFLHYLSYFKTLSI